MELKGITTQYIGQVLEYYKVVDSTNTVAKELARQGASEGTLVVAEQQTAGKGRLGKNWDSPEGVGIWMSLVLRPTIDMQSLSQITLIAGFAMCLAIREVTQEDIMIKWPNDLVLNRKKVCGVLCEAQLCGGTIEGVIVGVGVNVNTVEFPDELPYASSLMKETGTAYNRELIIQSFCKYFEQYYFQFKQNKSLGGFIKEYKQSCINVGNKVKILDGNKSFEGQVIDISATGQLIVEKEDRNIEKIIAGEVSVRGLYGYV